MPLNPREINAGCSALSASTSGGIRYRGLKTTRTQRPTHDILGKIALGKAEDGRPAGAKPEQWYLPRKLFLEESLVSRVVVRLALLQHGYLGCTPCSQAFSFTWEITGTKRVII